MQSAHYPPYVMARFWMKVRKHESGCWLWQGSLTGPGYGQFDHRAGQHGLAHRLSYEMLVGPIPEGLTLDHLCSVRNCVNPRHLEPCTLAENILRADSPPARNARMTHCPKGHPLNGDNLYIDPKFRRQCQACRREHGRAFRARQRAKRLEQQDAL